MLLLEMRMESDDDMTAAETAPSPMKDTTVGVRYVSAIGSASEVSIGTRVPFTDC